MPRSALACALAAGPLAAFAVAHERVGLGLACALLLVIAAAALAAERRRSPWLLAAAAALAVQPVIRDAGWVVAVGVAGALIAGAAAVAPAGSWTAVARLALAPLRLAAGSAAVALAARRLLPAAPSRHAPAVLRGTALAAVTTACFGWLFASADSAFHELASDGFGLDLDGWALLWRATLAAVTVAVAGALVRAGRAPVEGPPRRSRVPGRVELLMALGALVALFAVFVAVQLRVLFGGADYVRATTGLGYGDYARQGFVQLLLVAGLTLGVVAIAARRRDAAVRALLGALCGLTLVVLASAHHRLVLVEDAYGLTRVRYGGHAVVLWLAVIFVLVLAAGAHRRAGRAAPRVAVGLTVVAALAFSLSNPDARVAQSAVERAARGGKFDALYIGGLSADALPALERIPPGGRRGVLARIRADLERADGLAGWNVSRARARR